MTVNDALILLALLLTGFAVGYGGAILVRWLDQRRQNNARPQIMAGRGVVIALWPVGFNLGMAIAQAFRHNADAVQTHLIVVTFFTVMFLGAWAGTKRGVRRLGRGEK